MERREKSSSCIILIFFIPFLIWALIQFIAPLALPANSVEDLSGLTGVIDNDEKIHEMTAPWDSVYYTGDRLCHQKADRSFFINGNQMPFCSRCTAIWLGIAIGLGFMVFYIIRLNEKFIFILILGIAPIGLDGLGQLMGLWESTNFTRMLTGSIVGVVCGVAIGIITDEIIYSIKDLKLLKKKNIK